MDSGDLTCPAGPSTNEDEIINQIIALKMAGNRQWVVSFIEVFGPRMKGALMKRFKGELEVQDIEDVIQDFATGKCESPDRFDPNKGSLLSFCYRKMYWIAKGKIMKMQKIPIQSEVSPEDLEDMANPNPSSISPAQTETILILKEAINELPPREQEVVQTYVQYSDFFPLKEIAVLIGTTPNTFSVSFNHAKDRIKKFFASRGYDTDTLEKNT